jgi:hypothetical protein
MLALKKKKKIKKNIKKKKQKQFVIYSRNCVKMTISVPFKSAFSKPVTRFFMTLLPHTAARK